ncbi:MAG: YdcF family protein [Anaerolineae bacterium]|nr:YdcF family protein [Anaerolineae bacterium]
MFFFLSKTLPLFIYPIGLVCVLILLAIFLWRRRGWQTAVLLSAFFLLYLAANPLVSLWLARSLEWRYLPPDPLPQADVIVVLGGSTTMEGYPQTTVGLNDAADRLWYAAWLYHEGAADYLLLTGGKLPGNTTSEAERMAEALRLMGVPDAAMLLESESMNTYENAVLSKPLLQGHDLEMVLLVTSAIHMPRSMAIFTKQGMDVIPAPTDYEFVQPDWAEGENAGWFYWVLSLLPDANSLELTTSVMKEYVGIVIYRFRGWL